MNVWQFRHHANRDVPTSMVTIHVRAQEAIERLVVSNIVISVKVRCLATSILSIDTFILYILVIIQIMLTV